MKKKRSAQLRSKLAKGLMSVFILALFTLPVYLTGAWIKGVFFTNDPRKVATVAPLQVRAADRGKSRVQPFNEPIVTITFDDGWETTYSTALPLLQRHGLPTTQYILGGVFEDPNYMSIAQLHSMQKAGHEIASHSMTHPDLTTLNDAALDWQLAESKRVLAEEFGVVKDFASPLGAADDRTREAIKKIYRSQRNTEGDPRTVDDEDINVASNLNLYSIKAYTVRETTTIEDIQRLLDYTIKRNGWLVLTYHQMSGSQGGHADESEYAVSPEVLEQQLNLISKSKVRAATLGQVLDALPNKAGSR